MPRDRPMLPQQAAAIPIRRTKAAAEICLIRRRDSDRWGIPKGSVDPGETHEETALKEAWEEAGISGRLVGVPLGRYTYDKWDRTLEVIVFLMEVLEQHRQWDEASWRERRWASFGDARSLLADHPARVFLDRARTLSDSIR